MTTMDTHHTAAMTVAVEHNGIEWTATCDALPGWKCALPGAITKTAALLLGAARAHEKQARTLSSLADEDIRRTCP